MPNLEERNSLLIASNKLQKEGLQFSDGANHSSYTLFLEWPSADFEHSTQIWSFLILNLILKYIFSEFLQRKSVHFKVTLEVFAVKFLN